MISFTNGLKCVLLVFIVVLQLIIMLRATYVDDVSESTDLACSDSGGKTVQLATFLKWGIA